MHYEFSKRFRAWVAVNSMAPQGDSHPIGGSVEGKTGAKFPRGLRLLRHADFERVYKEGRRQFSAHMTVFYLRRGEGGVRVGFTVGKLLGGAVERNRIKRRLREAVRQQAVKPAVVADVVINPKKSVLTLNFAELMGEVGQAFAAIEQKLRSAE